MLRRECESLFGAVRYFTRLPVPAGVGHDAAKLDRAARYFPLVGVLVGAVAVLAFEAAALVLPRSLALLVSMATTIALTGAFHEDGLADAVDGLGGGWTREQALAIMKDSRLGSYGAIAVALALLAKYQALMEMPRELVAGALVAAHAASRFASVTLIAALDYVRDDETARAKPLAQRVGAGGIAVAAAFGLAPLLALPWLAATLAALLAAAITFLAARYFLRRLGGYTGDCLGATQQLAELAIYLSIVAATWTST